MINFFFNALFFFRPGFSRNSPRLLFCMVVIGFVSANEMAGVTSICRFWGLGNHGYNALLHFFRSGAWSLGNRSLPPMFGITTRDGFPRYNLAHGGSM